MAIDEASLQDYVSKDYKSSLVATSALHLSAAMSGGGSPCQELTRRVSTCGGPSPPPKMQKSWFGGPRVDNGICIQWHVDPGSGFSIRIEPQHRLWQVLLVCVVPRFDLAQALGHNLPPTVTMEPFRQGR